MLFAQFITSPASQVDLGSTFVAGLTGSLTRIDIPIAAYVRTGPAIDARVRVWTVDGTGKPNFPLLATQVIPQATLVAAIPGTLSTTFLAPATVTAGTTYAFTIGFVLGAGTLDSQLGLVYGPPATGKSLAKIDTGVFSAVPTDGISFTTYVDATLPAAPAPSAPGLAKTGFDAQPYLLLAGGLLGVGVIAFGISSTLRRRKA
jgi:hypothetical protein